MKLHLSSSDWPAILQAALLVKKKKSEEALESLLVYQSSNPSSEFSADFHLTLAHVALLCGCYREASSSLMSLDTSLRLKPAVVATIVDLQVLITDCVCMAFNVFCFVNCR